MQALPLFYMIAIGIVSGFISGFMGTGVGIVIVPFLVWFFSHTLHYNLTNSFLIATSTSIAIMFVTSFFNYYVRRGTVNIDKKLILNLLILLLFTSAVGVALKKYFPVEVYRFVICGLLVYFGVKTLQSVTKNYTPPNKTWFHTSCFYIKCTLIYILTVIAGTGSGKMMIPLFRSAGIERSSAIATSKYLAIFNCFIITVLSMALHKSSVKMPYCIGSVNMLALGIISLSSLPSLYYGIIVSEKIKTHIYDYIFSGFLFFSAGMLYFIGL